MVDVNKYLNNGTDAASSYDSYETYMIAELNFPDSYGNPVWGVVRKRVRNNYGEPVSVVNQNPLIDTSKYEVQYLVFFVEDITVNQTTENMLSQVKSEKDHLVLLKYITDH